MTTAIVPNQDAGEDIGVYTTIADDKRARLMYYLGCVCSVLDLSDHESLYRFNDDSSYQRIWTLKDKNELLIWCLKLVPEFLDKKCFFHSEEIESSNEFFSLFDLDEDTRAELSSVWISGRERRVVNVMVYKMEWMQHNYFKPLKELNEEIKIHENILAVNSSHLELKGQVGRATSQGKYYCNIL